jgi:hypothetical protein
MREMPFDWYRFIPRSRRAECRYAGQDSDRVMRLIVSPVASTVVSGGKICYCYHW